jgi:DNA replication protein DnaC
MAEVSKIRELDRKLNLMNVANGVIDINNEVVSNKEYLLKILEEELDIRYQNKIKELKSDSHLPNKEFDHSKITKGLEWQLDRIKQIDFKNNNQNIIIVGECSSGKTALAAEIGNAMILKEAKVKYVTIDNLLFIKKAKPRQ